MISIIVPCYNAENFIYRNLDSLLNQSDKNFEVIYVNDGSLDTTEIQLKKIANTYDFVTFVSIPNSGVMYARRKGLEYARFEYVSFLDVDDIIDCDFIFNFNKYIIFNDFDIIGSNFKILKNNNIKYLNTFIPGVYTKDQFLESLCCNSGWELCGKIYKKSLFLSVEYPEKITIGEDALVFFQLVLFSKKIKIIDHYLYIYIHHLASASNIKSLDKCRDGLKSALYIKNLLRVHGDIEIEFSDSLMLLFFSNSLRRGLLKRSDVFFNEINKSLTLKALANLSFKKKIIVLIGFILMGLNF